MYEARLMAYVAAVQRGELVIDEYPLRQMQRRQITVAEVHTVLTSPTADIIEDYRDDPRGPRCLILGWVGGRPLHVVVTYPPMPYVVTAYDPRSEPHAWGADYRTRRRQP